MPAREERGRGVPLDDAERVARHYNLSIEDACELLLSYSVEDLLPERGAGLPAAFSPSTEVANMPDNFELVGHTAGELNYGLRVMQAALKAGDRVEVAIVSSNIPNEDDLANFYVRATAMGARISYPSFSIVDGLPVTSFKARYVPVEPGTTGFAFAALIPLIPVALIVGLISFGIVKIGDISKALVPLLLISFGGMIVLAGILTRKPVVEAAGKFAERRLPKTKLKFMPGTELAKEYQFPKGKFPPPEKVGPEHLPRVEWQAQTELQDEVRKIWRKACEWEGVSPEAKFVAFSKDNPFNEEYERAMGRLLRYKQWRAGQWQPQTVEKGWKDFYKGNRVQASIDAYNWRIQHRDIPQEKLDALNESLKTDFMELVEYQNLQSQAFAMGKITKDEAMQLYQMYGGEAPSPEKWDKLSLAEKVTGTKFAQELLEMKMRGGFQAKTEPSYEEVEMFCQQCGEKIPAPSSFRDAETLRQYFITGLCQRCQDLPWRLASGVKVPEEYKKVLFTNAFPKREKAIAGLEPVVEVLEVHSDGDLTVADGRGAKFVVTTEGEVYLHHTAKEALQKILGDQYLTITDPGKSQFKKGEVVTLWAFYKENERLRQQKEEQASGTYEIVGKKAGDGNGRKNLLEFLGDSPEFLAYTIDMTGWRQQLNETFQTAIQRARS